MYSNLFFLLGFYIIKLSFNGGGSKNGCLWVTLYLVLIKEQTFCPEICESVPFFFWHLNQDTANGMCSNLFCWGLYYKICFNGGEVKGSSISP